MAINPQQPTFNSPESGSAWWIEIGTDGVARFGAWQGYNVYSRFKELLAYRALNTTGTLSRIGADVVNALNGQFRVNTDASISVGDLRWAKAWVNSNSSVLGAQGDRMVEILDEAINGGDGRAPSIYLLSFIMWFAFGAQGGIPFVTTYQGQAAATYSIYPNTLAPALGAAPPPPVAGSLAQQVVWLATAPIPASVAPAGGGTTAVIPANVAQTAIDANKPMNWTPWIIGGVVVGLLAVGGGVWYFSKKKRERERDSLGYGGYGSSYEDMGMRRLGDGSGMSAMERARKGAYRRHAHR